MDQGQSRSIQLCLYSPNVTSDHMRMLGEKNLSTRFKTMKAGKAKEDGGEETAKLDLPTRKAGKGITFFFSNETLNGFKSGNKRQQKM